MQVEGFLTGAIVMGNVVVGLFFLRFWRDTCDRLFLIFAVAFWLSAAARILLVMTGIRDEPTTAIYPYLMRLASYVLILVAIVDKNNFFRRGGLETGA
jgi:hypothetical protein